MQQIIGVFLGLATVFFVLSVFASHIQEMLAAFLTKRATQLEDAITTMLRDPDIVSRFFAHPLIQSSATNTPRKSRFGHNSANPRPSYITSATFAKVLQSVLGTYYAPATAGLTDVIKGVPESSLKKMLSTVLIGVTDEASASAAIEQWFDDTMTRLSGMYKRHTQRSLLILGFGLAVLVNANVVHMTSVLWKSSDARNQAETLANQYANDPACKAAAEAAAEEQKKQAAAQTQATDSAAAKAVNTCGPTDWNSLNKQLASFPVGWTHEEADAWKTAFAPLQDLFRKKFFSKEEAKAAVTMSRNTLLPLLLALLGWLGTAVAVSFGSSFWFDLINQVVNLRLSGPKPAPDAKRAPASKTSA